MILEVIANVEGGWIMANKGENIVKRLSLFNWKCKGVNEVKYDSDWISSIYSSNIDTYMNISM